MLFYLGLAFKNLGRHRKRTIITSLAIAVGLMTFLLMDSMLQGADQMSETNLVRYETGGLRIYSPEGAEARDRLTLRFPLAGSPEIKKLLEAKGWKVSARITLQGELTLTDPRFEAPGSTVVRVLAMDPEDDAKVFPQKGSTMSGRWFGPREDGMVVGAWLAEDLGIRTGDTLSLACRTREGTLQVLDLVVTGLLDSPNPNMNRGSVFVPLWVADRELGMGGNVTELVLPAEPGTDVEALGAEITALLNKNGFTATVLDWKDLAADFLAISGTKKKGTSMILFLVFVIAAVGIGNTLLMAFFERRNEIGMLRALGMDDRTLFWTFIAEAAGIGVIGSLIGLALGGAAVAYLVYVGFDFSFVTRTMDIGYRISGTFYGLWIPKSFVTAFVLGVGLSAFMAIFPTRRALKLPITESLRTE